MRDGYKRLTAAICGKAGLTLTLFHSSSAYAHFRRPSIRTLFILPFFDCTSFFSTNNQPTTNHQNEVHSHRRRPRCLRRCPLQRGDLLRSRDRHRHRVSPVPNNLIKPSHPNMITQDSLLRHPHPQRPGLPRRHPPGPLPHRPCCPRRPHRRCFDSPRLHRRHC